MRVLILLAMLLVAGACWRGQATPAAPAPTNRDAADDSARLVVDSGTLARARLTSGKTITGSLLAPFTPASFELVLCAAPRGAPCSTADSAHIYRLRASDLKGVDVRDRLTGNFGLMGFYAGSLAWMLSRRGESDDAWPLVGFASAVLSGLIGSRVTGWVPLFPCGYHTQCGWHGAKRDLAPPER